MRIAPKRSLGQNFLINPAILEKIVRAAGVHSNDTILEIGPGTGSLTELLAQRAGRLVAVEKDRRLIPELRRRFASSPRVEIVEDDILHFSPSRYNLTATGYKLVGNIPYYLTSRLLRIVFESWPQPELVVLTVQREVAQRICAKPPHMNLLALSVQYYAESSIVAAVSRGSFRPVPKVDSSVILLTPRPVRQEKALTARLFRLMHIGFSSKRKQLASTLSSGLAANRAPLRRALETMGLPATARPENLSLEQWEQLAETLSTDVPQE